MVPVVANKAAGKIVRAFEDDDGDDPVREPTGPVSVRVQVAGVVRKDDISDRARVVRRAAACVRAKIGLPKRSEANYLVVRKLVVEYLETIPDLRKVHYLKIVPLAVELVFVPTKYDIEARDFAGSSFVVERRADYHADRAVEVQGWGPWGLFGRKRAVTYQPSA